MGDVGAVAKLAQYTMSLLAEPLLATLRARQEVKANRIRAEGQAEIVEILAIGEAKAELAGKAVRELAEDPQGLAALIENEIDRRVESHFQKRVNNLAQIVARAERALPPGQVPDVEPDMAWTASYSEAAQDISDEEMQELWARTLAGEVASPGSTSIRTLSVLRNLDQRTAQSFRRLCSLSVSLWLGDLPCLDHRLVSFGEGTHRNSPTNFGIRFGDLLVLNEYGLIVSAFNTQADYRVAVWGPGNLAPGREQAGRLEFQGQQWALIYDEEWDFNQELWVQGVNVTQAGQELSKVVELEPVPKHAEALKGYFAEKGLDMVQV